MPHKMIVLFLTAAIVFGLCAGCANSEPQKQTASAAGTLPPLTEAPAPENQSMADLLHGTWAGTTPDGLYEAFDFSGNRVIFTGYDVDTPHKVHTNEAIFSVLDDKLVMYFEETDYTNVLDLSLEDGVPVISVTYPEEDYTRVYRKMDAVPPAAEAPAAEAPTEDFAYLDDLWYIRGIYHKGHLIDVHDNGALKDLYGSYCLNFFEDGTFHYMGLFNNRGKYTKRQDGAWLLKTEAVFTYDMTSSGMVEKESENSEKKTYLITPLDENTLLWNEFDPLMGKAAADSKDYIFVRSSKDSAYLSSQKTPLSGSSQSGNSPTSVPPAPTQASPSVTVPSPGSTGSSLNVTSGMRNALQSAKNYLSVMPFSHSGLVDQLEFEGYTHSEATYAADNCGADWYDQAVRKAEQYLEIMSFSKSALIGQLEFDGFTHDQAVHGVDMAY